MYHTWVFLALENQPTQEKPQTVKSITVVLKQLSVSTNCLTSVLKCWHRKSFTCRSSWSRNLLWAIFSPLKVTSQRYRSQKEGGLLRSKTKYFCWQMVFENNVKKQGAQPVLMFLREKDKLSVLWPSWGVEDTDFISSDKLHSFREPSRLRQHERLALPLQSGLRAHWDRNSPEVEMPNSLPVLPTHSLLKPVLKGSNVPLPEVPPKYWVILGSPQSRSEQLTPVHTAVEQAGPQP